MSLLRQATSEPAAYFSGGAGDEDVHAASVRCAAEKGL
jgi:hypothetical protein